MLATHEMQYAGCPNANTTVWRCATCGAETTVHYAPASTSYNGDSTVEFEHTYPEDIEFNLDGLPLMPERKLLRSPLDTMLTGKPQEYGILKQSQPNWIKSALNILDTISPLDNAEMEQYLSAMFERAGL